MTTKTAMPDSEPAPSFDTGFLDVGQGHRLYYEQAGAAGGIPVVMLHGGPGSGASPRQRIFFAAERYRLVQFDQRGCGRSEPRGETKHNHTDALIADIEALRRHLGIERWLVFGGSWGSALALAYAAKHRESVTGLILRGVFLTGNADIAWFFHGVKAFAPQASQQFMSAIPRRWRRSVATYLDRCMSGTDVPRARQMAACWQHYEAALNGTQPNVVDGRVGSESTALHDKYRVQAHYLARKCFLGERVLIGAAASLRNLPVAIIHGTHDLVCRPHNAWRLQCACAGSRLAWAELAGHDPFHPSCTRLLRSATNWFAVHGDFTGWPAGTEGKR